MNTSTKRARNGATAAERIAFRAVEDEAGCWIWTGAIATNGYGVLSFGNRMVSAHRLSYQTFVGPIPSGLHIDHLCRVRACCNPTHLEVVTSQTNVRRGESPGAKARRRERCLHGHPYAEHGVISRGRRVCGRCRIIYARLNRSTTREERQRRRDAGLPMVDLAAYFASQEQAS